MKFLLIDKIEEFEPGKRIRTSKSLSLAEEYLQDHFPSFPVIPGVLMLEGMIQSAEWLIRHYQDYANSVITLKSARNIRYNHFLKPGDTMKYEVELQKIDDDSATFKGTGTNGEKLAVSGRLELVWQNIADKGSYGQKIDQLLVGDFQERFRMLSRDLFSA